MNKNKILTTAEEIKALSDPFRYRILDTLYKFEDGATVKQLGQALDEVPSKIHYHVKKLEKVGIVVLDHTKEINGIIAKFYKPTAETFDIRCEDSSLSESSKKLMLGETQRMISELYDTSKNTFLNLIQGNTLTNDKKSKGSFIMNTLYLSEEEFVEFISYLETFFKNNNTRKNENQLPFHGFVSIFRNTEDN